MTGYRDYGHMLDSAALKGLCCPNCYGPNRGVKDESGAVRCSDCAESEEDTA